MGIYTLRDNTFVSDEISSKPIITKLVNKSLNELMLSLNLRVTIV
ncbi:hypothetical protein ADO07_00124 [Streptococcus parauberis]|nr:hypothetical protein ADO07_00124 [Streptococcus parauberis]